MNIKRLLLVALLSISTIYAETTLEMVAKNIETATTEDIQNVLATHDEACFELLEAALQKIEFISKKKIKLLIKHAKKKDHARLRALLVKYKDKPLKKQISLLSAIMNTKGIGYIKRKYPCFLPSLQAITQSDWHIKKHIDTVKDFHASDLKNKDLQKMLVALNEQEQKETAKGNYTFVHGQTWDLHFAADIFKKLWELQYDETIHNYQFLRFRHKIPKL